MSRASTKARRPSRTFLSWPISATSAGGVGQRAGDVGEAVPHAHRGEMRGDAARRLLRAEAEAGREVEGERAADRDRLAVQQPVGVAGGGLERVAEGVAEVEERALALLGLVADDDRGLHLAGAADGVQARVRVAGGEGGGVRLEPGEEAGVAEQAVLRHLGVAGAEVAGRQRVEERGVGEHQPRLVEGADEVLALGRVDPGLAADRAVDLGEQRRRHLHEADAAAQDRGGEAGEVADDAAAEGEDEVVAVDLRGDQPLDGALEPGPALGGLAGRQHERRRLDPGVARGPPRAPAGAAPRRVASVTIASRGRRSSGAISAPARASRPAPMRMS